MSGLRDKLNAYDVESVSETYPQSVQITDLQKELGTKGHVLVVRGDKAYEDKVGELANPKFWLYENLLNSDNVQEQLRVNPEHKLFDGVGFSALEALGWHSKRLGRKALVVMAHEFLPDPEVFQRYDIEVVHGDLPTEEGYVEKQREVLRERKDIIPLHQALYGARFLAPIGNRVASQLEEMDIVPDASFWCIASGSNLYGVGHKVKQKFPNGRIYVVEPRNTATIPQDLELSNPEAVKEFSKANLRDYSLDEWVENGKKHSGVWPLHARHPNMYLLRAWAHSGDIGFDEATYLQTEDINGTHRMLRGLNPDYDWTKTTALTLNPAIEMAKEGKNVLVMAYGKHRENRYRDVAVNGQR
tara:strand:- start:132 stop:1205 length:1074 start_codon:yes stop_codon:yes gene_type:complete